MRPTHERVRELLHYDPETGVFTWRISGGSVRVGDVAGTPHKGYWRIGVDKRTYRAHQLAWLYVTGIWPEHEIDHVNGVKDDNRWVNLRDGSDGVNRWNIVVPQSNNSSGLRGVSRHEGRWQAQIEAHGKKRHLGLFDTPEEASAAYWAAKAELHGVETYQGRLV